MDTGSRALSYANVMACNPLQGNAGEAKGDRWRGDVSCDRPVSGGRTDPASLN